MNVVTFFISHRIFCCFVYHGLWSQGHRSREIFKSAFISRFHWNHPSLILVSLDSLDGFSETSKFFAVFLKPCGGFRARIWPEMAKSKVSENCHQLHVQFQKTFTSLCSFEKNYQFHVQFQKKNVNFVCSMGETIRHFAKKKKTRLQVVILIACKKKQNRVAKFWNSVRFFSYSFFWTFLFFPRTIFQICNLESTFYVFFFSFIFSNFTLLQRVLSNSNETENGFTETIWNFLKLFATVIFSLKLAAKKK